jgi:hypothetical protein
MKCGNLKFICILRFPLIFPHYFSLLSLAHIDVYEKIERIYVFEKRDCDLKAKTLEFDFYFYAPSSSHNIKFGSKNEILVHNILFFPM